MVKDQEIKWSGSTDKQNGLQLHVNGELRGTIHDRTKNGKPDGYTMTIIKGGRER